MDGCFKIMMNEIHKYEGTINQFTGDGIMAIFGAPLAHESHAQRGCYAALSIKKILQNYSVNMRNKYGIDFSMRMGLNSGPVVVASIGDNLRMDYTAVGDTTNLAARMESLAKPGNINVSVEPQTYIMLPNEVKSLAHRGEKSGRVSYWLQPKAYCTEEFHEAWPRIGKPK